MMPILWSPPSAFSNISTSNPAYLQTVVGRYPVGTPSKEASRYLALKLHEMGVLRLVEGGYGVRLFIQDHLKLEDLPREAAGPSLENALEDFRRTRQETARSLDALKAEQQKLKQGRVSEIEKKLREELRKGKPEST
ncbi:MAG: hypothetical protein U5J82_01990 [Desulfobacterales bacterium]|nr:hypothetical protein [Desulfobacterales bacterium]